MKYLLAALVVAFLSGCVSSDQLRSRTPTLTVTSQKSAREVAACITGKWEKAGIFGMTMPIDNKILADGYSVSYKNGQMVQLMADVHEAGTGSTTSYFKVDMVAGVAKFETAVRDCQ